MPACEYSLLPDYLILDVTKALYERSVFGSSSEYELLLQKGTTLQKMGEKRAFVEFPTGRGYVFVDIMEVKR